MPYYRFLGLGDDFNEVEYGSFEVVELTQWEIDEAIRDSIREGYDNPLEDDSFLSDPGFYWVAGLPGCLWDGEPTGPFDSEEKAIADAQSY
jgi:hypothetical protein